MHTQFVLLNQLALKKTADLPFHLSSCLILSSRVTFCTVLVHVQASKRQCVSTCTGADNFVCLCKVKSAFSPLCSAKICCSAEVIRFRGANSTVTVVTVKCVHFLKAFLQIAHVRRSPSSVVLKPSCHSNQLNQTGAARH